MRILDYIKKFEQRKTKYKDKILTLKDARAIMEIPYLTEEEKITKLKYEGASDSMIRNASLFSQGRWKVKR